MRVDFYALQKKIGQVELIVGRLKFSGMAARITRGLVVVEPGNPSRVLIPADAEAYLRALPYEFRSPYLRAVLK